MLITSSLHILCFGDSITAGFSQAGALYHPYAPSMQSSLEEAFPSVNISTDIRGLPGDQVTSPPGSFLPRMNVAFEETPTPYTIAVILGGTNDLNNNRLSLDIYSALQSVWSIPLAHNTKILALTVPECGFCSPVWDERSLDLNDLILDHEAENFYTLDLHSAIPFWSMPNAKRREIWDDGVHFTAKGYDLMGNIVADRLVEVIKGLEGVDEEDAKEWQRGELKRRRADSGL